MQANPNLDARLKNTNGTPKRLGLTATEKSALIQTFNLNGSENQKPFIKGGLSNPMKVAWGQAAPQAGDATLDVQLTGLNLADWKAFAGDLSPNGLVNMTLKLVSQQSGKLLAFNVDPQFSQALDGLMLVDLTKTDQRLLRRYLGESQAESFLRFHEPEFHIRESSSATAIG